jgi:uncharacterized protein YdaU (DUF1376 family)
MNGFTWWIDRWRKSSAFTDMTLEQQAAYRNLLEEAWLRGGGIPNNPRTLAQACGDAQAWARVKGVVMKRFHLVNGTWHHDTLDKFLRRADLHAKRQAAYRKRKGNGKSDA